MQLNVSHKLLTRQAASSSNQVGWVIDIFKSLESIFVAMNAAFQLEAISPESLFCQ
jgi:hypothetical protein